MRKRINDQSINTTSFKEDVEFSADTPHSVQIKHFPCDEIVPLHYAETLEMLVHDHHPALLCPFYRLPSWRWNAL